MVEMGFLCFLAALLVLTVMFQEPTKSPEQLTSNFPGYGYADTHYETSETFTTLVPEYDETEYESPEELTTFVPEYESADPQYGGDNSFRFVPNPSLLEDNAGFPVETDYISSDYDRVYVPEEHIQSQPTGPVATEMDILQQDSEYFTFSSEQLDFDTTPAVQVDINTTGTNYTAVTCQKDIPLCTAITPFRFYIVMLTIFCAVLFIITIIMMWKNDFKFVSIKYKIMYKISSEISGNTEVVNGKNQDIFTI